MIIRAEKTTEYTVVANHALNNLKLSLRAKGLWAFIMTKPDNWNITSRGLASQLKEGKDGVLAAMKELEDAGYLVRGRQKQVNGRFITMESILYEKPKTVSAFPDTEFPDTEKPAVLVNTKQVNTKQDRADELLAIVNEVTGRKLRTLPNGWKTTLKTFTLEEVKSALLTLSKDEWHSPRLKTLNIAYLLRPTTIDKFLGESSGDAERSIGWD